MHPPKPNVGVENEHLSRFPISIGHWVGRPLVAKRLPPQRERSFRFTAGLRHDKLNNFSGPHFDTLDAKIPLTIGDEADVLFRGVVTHDIKDSREL